jgi:hypothetical protein
MFWIFFHKMAQTKITWGFGYQTEFKIILSLFYMHYTTNTSCSYYCYWTNFRNGTEHNVLNARECPSENIKGVNLLWLEYVIITETPYFLTHDKRYLCNYVAYVYKVPCKKKIINKYVFLLHSQRGWILSECCKVKFFSSFRYSYDVTKMIIKHCFL